MEHWHTPRKQNGELREKWRVLKREQNIIAFHESIPTAMHGVFCGQTKAFLQIVILLEAWGINVNTLMGREHRIIVFRRENTEKGDYN
jgi:hypothetical protein